MKFCAWSALSLLALAATVSAAPANGVRPVMPPHPPIALRNGAQEVKLVVVVDPTVGRARLEVPSNLVVTPVAPGFRNFGGFGAADRTPNVMAGLALALAFTSGGLWLSKRGRSAAIALAAVSLLSFGGAVGADFARPVKESPVVLPANVNLSNKLTLQIVGPGDAVRLVVNKSMVTPERRAKIVPPARKE